MEQKIIANELRIILFSPLHCRPSHLIRFHLLVPYHVATAVCVNTISKCAAQLCLNNKVRTAPHTLVCVCVCGSCRKKIKDYDDDEGNRSAANEFLCFTLSVGSDLNKNKSTDRPTEPTNTQTNK